MKEVTTNQRWVFVISGVLFFFAGIPAFFFDAIGTGVLFILLGLLTFIYANHLNKNRVKIQAKNIIDNTKVSARETLNMINSQFKRKGIRFDKKNVKSTSVLHEKIEAKDIHFVYANRRINHKSSAGEKYVAGSDADLSYYVPKTFKDLSDQTIERVVPASIKTSECSILDVPCSCCGGMGKCTECHGSGHVVCKKCGGKKRVERYKNGNRVFEKCSKCMGLGRLQCDACEGSGNCTYCEGSGRNLCRRCEGTGVYQEYDLAVDSYSEMVKTIYNSHLERELLDKLDVTTVGEIKKVYSANNGFAYKAIQTLTENVRQTIESAVETSGNIVLVGVSHKECVMHILQYSYEGDDHKIIFSTNEIIASTV